MLGFLKSVSRRRAPPGMTVAQRRALGRLPPSFTDLLPWMDYDPQDQTLVLEDGISRAAVLELTPTATEGRSADVLAGQAEAIANALNGSFPEVDAGEWVAQFFVQDDPCLDALADDIERYIAPDIRRSAYTQDYLHGMRRHLRQVSQASGLFIDTEVSGNRFRGQRRRIRAVLYRRYPAGHDFGRDGMGAAEHLKNVCDRFESSLRQGGVPARRCTGRDFYEWLLPWFNPASGAAPGGVADLLRVAPYPGDENLPFGRDFAEQLTLTPPRSDLARGFWYFDGVPHLALTFQALRTRPCIGHFTAERAFDDGKRYALFDKLPEGAVLSLTVTLRAQDRLREHVSRIERAATGDSAEAELTRENCRDVKRCMAQGDKLLPVSMVLYLRGDDERDLRLKANQANAALLPSGMKFIDRQEDLLALTAYIRGLPMAFDPAFDLRHLKRSRLVFSSDVAAMLPVYGRSRGTGSPGNVYFNRGGEPLLFDPLNRHDRKKNAFKLILGPMGAGKSATCAYELMQAAAIYRPRIFIIDAGNSYGLLGQHFARLGLTLNHVNLNPSADVSLPPFADACKYLDEQRRPDLAITDIPEADLTEECGDEEDPDERRDILGEMEIAARIMITGGEEKESARLTRADRFFIRQALVNAARACRSAGRALVLTEDVAQALLHLSGDGALPEARRNRVAEMGEAMMLFTQGLEGHFFNRPGSYWPDTDVTLFEMGILSREGYEDKLALAYTSLMNHINALVEARQHEARPTIVATDEAHLIMRNPLLSPYVVKITKMWRKLGTWLWLATQNMQDFPDAAARVLNVIEWWTCLTMPVAEVEELARFRKLSPETRQLLLSARKEPGKYTEGVILTDTFEALFRSVPPPLPLALAMTEKHEKAQRAQIMRERGCSELEAAYAVAQMLEQAGEQP